VITIKLSLAIETFLVTSTAILLKLRRRNLAK